MYNHFRSPAHTLHARNQLQELRNNFAKGRSAPSLIQRSELQKCIDYLREYTELLLLLRDLKIDSKELLCSLQLQKGLQKGSDMHLMHVTQDGDRMFIGQMSDKHLQNTINFILSKIEGGLAIGGGTATITPKQAAVLGIDIENIQKEERGRISERLQAVYPYLAEANLRWVDINDTTGTRYLCIVRDRLRDIMDRTERMAPLSLTEMLPASICKQRLLPATEYGVPIPEDEKTDYITVPEGGSDAESVVTVSHTPGSRPHPVSSEDRSKNL